MRPHDSIEIFYIVLQSRGAFEGERLTVFRAIRAASIDSAIYQRQPPDREAGDFARLSGANSVETIGIGIRDYYRTERRNYRRYF